MSSVFSCFSGETLTLVKKNNPRPELALKFNRLSGLLPIKAAGTEDLCEDLPGFSARGCCHKMLHTTSMSNEQQIRWEKKGLVIYLILKTTLLTIPDKSSHAAKQDSLSLEQDSCSYD